MLCFTHISSHQLFRIIDRSYGCFSLGDVGVVIGVVGDQQHFCQKKRKIAIYVTTFCFILVWTVDKKTGITHRVHG